MHVCAESHRTQRLESTDHLAYFESSTQKAKFSVQGRCGQWTSRLGFNVFLIVGFEEGRKFVLPVAFLSSFCKAGFKLTLPGGP